MTAPEPDLRDQLVAIRKWRNLTHRQVAERMGVSRACVSMFELRKERKPRLSTIEAYAKAIDAEIGAWPLPIALPPEVKRPSQFTKYQERKQEWQQQLR